jgi:hypothetical protein
MTDVAAILGISALCMVLIAVITSSDFVPQNLPRPRFPSRNDFGAIELPPFATPWSGLYDGMDVPDHQRRELRPQSTTRDRSRVTPAGPYR